MAAKPESLTRWRPSGLLPGSRPVDFNHQNGLVFRLAPKIAWVPGRIADAPRGANHALVRVMHMPADPVLGPNLPDQVLAVVDEIAVQLVSLETWCGGVPGRWPMGHDHVDPTGLLAQQPGLAGMLVQVSGPPTSWPWSSYCAVKIVHPLANLFDKFRDTRRPVDRTGRNTTALPKTARRRSRYALGRAGSADRESAAP